MDKLFGRCFQSIGILILAAALLSAQDWKTVSGREEHSP
jgi:hypothetical protein